jgi:integrase
MRRRYKEGGLKKYKGFWVAQYWDDGHRRNRIVGRVSQVTKAEARLKLASVLTPINLKRQPASVEVNLADFVSGLFLPFYRKKWKLSTGKSNEHRIQYHLVSEFGKRSLREISRDDLQDFLDRKAAAGASHSLVSHLRWDVKQIFALAQGEGLVDRNPGAILFVPRLAKRPVRLVMNIGQVKNVFSTLELRERLIVKLAVLAGLRPGEIFGLTWDRVQDGFVEVRQRVYRGKVDTPKTSNSVRKVALSSGVCGELKRWRGIAFDTKPGAWVFPSERLNSPLSKDNCWRRYVGPRLRELGLGWVNFQVMRRTHSSLMNDLKVDPKLVADQLGHTLDVNQNIYTHVGLERRKEAVELLEKAVGTLME